MAKETKKPDLKMFQEEIRKSAEEIYKKRISTNKPGDTFSDWLQAEKEIKKKYNI